MDVPSRSKRSSRSGKSRVGRRKQKAENSVFEVIVARPITTMCCSVLLCGVALWATVSDNDHYSHVDVEANPDFVKRKLRSESPPSALSSIAHSSNRQTKMIASTRTTVSVIQQQQRQQEQNPNPTVSGPEKKLNSQLEKISPISCTEQLANRKLDSADPNRHMKESPYKHVTLTDPNMYISLHNKKYDDMRWAYIYKKGNYYESGITEQFRSILGNTTEPGLVIDVGMNIGWFSVYSRAMGHKVVGFDPNPTMHTRLCESVQLNGWLEDSTVQSFAYGLGAETAMLPFTIGKNPGKASFFEDRMAKRFRKKIEIPVVRLDDVADQQDWLNDDARTPIYLWKLDVEGYEYHVLEGAKKLLQSRRVKNILLENSNSDVQQVAKMHTDIYSAGYEIKMLSNTEGTPYRSKMVAPLNKIFAQAASVESLLDKPEITLFTKVTCNIWWVLREDHMIESKS